MKKKIAGSLVLVLSVFLLSGCGSKEENGVSSGEATKSMETAADAAGSKTNAEGFCGVFTKEIVASATGLDITSAEAYTVEGMENVSCRYYVGGKKIAPVITIGKFKNDLEAVKKKYLEHPLFKGWKILENKEIAMKNFVTYNEVQQLNDIFLITGTNEYYRITLYSFDKIGSKQMVDLALQVEQKISD